MCTRERVHIPSRIDRVAGPAGARGEGKGQMASTGYDIAAATRDDMAGIVALQERNLQENGGRLSVRFSAGWFEDALSDLPIIVARKSGCVVGYLVSSSKAAQAHVPIIQATLRTYPGAADAYVYGPICIAESERGQGLPAALMSALRTRLPGREGITFIRRDNEQSLRAHAKIGMREVGEFVHANAAIVVISNPG
jgi:L-amino acid N-acyltransferase YncA